MDGFTIRDSERFLNTGDLPSSSLVGKRSRTETSSVVEGTNSFQETLNQAIQQVNDLQVISDKSMQNLATGRTDNVADVMIAAEKADIALRTMVQVRNKIIDAYQEIMKMQV